MVSGARGARPARPGRSGYEESEQGEEACGAGRFDRSGRGVYDPGPGSGRRAGEGLSKSSGQRQAARLVALDERQHHQGRNQARPGVDEAGGDRRFSEFRRSAEHSHDRGKTAGVHDAGMAGRLPLRRHTGGPIEDGNGDRGLAGLERERRALGDAGAGHEEIRLERDMGGGGTAFRGRIAEAARYARSVSEYWCGQGKAGHGCPRGVLRGCGRDSLPRSGSREAHGAVAAQGDIQRRRFHAGGSDGRRPGSIELAAGGSGGPERLDSV